MQIYLLFQLKHCSLPVGCLNVEYLEQKINSTFDLLTLNATVGADFRRR
ncbi:hypothetical protein SAMD00079811_67470 [Scytonema sp. HK-05]|nr:hypothetical protein SAMD00079811_67470 [Scytonema sp. HK-05]